MFRKEMTAITDTGFINNLEREVRKTVLGLFPSEWHEDTISYLVLKSIRDRFSRSRMWLGRNDPEGVLWSAYKYSGTLEQKHGDIGILVKIIYRDGGVLEGVGFLEAKKRFPRKLTFDSLNIPQLSKLAKTSPHTNLLLYDYEDITGFVSNSSVPLGLLKEQEASQGLALKPVTNALVVQSGVVLETRAKDLTLYKYGVPFSHQLILRYMQGLDLDHRKNIVDSVKGFNSKYGYCTYLLKVTISHGNADIQENRTEINGNIYQEIET